MRASLDGFPLLFGAALLGLAPGCTAITGGDFEDRQAPLECGSDPTSAVVDLRLDLTSFNAHQSNVVIAELARIEGTERIQVARAVWDPLGAADVQIVIPCTVQVGARHEVDLFADLNGNRRYDPCTTNARGELECPDHQWRLPVQDDGTVAYQHNLDFANIADGAPTPRGTLPLTLRLDNVDAFAGHLAEARVRLMEGETAQQVVFLYRIAELPDPAISAPVPIPVLNVVNRGERFKVAIWIDTNDNGIYDPPSGIGVEGRDYATTIDAVAEPITGADVNFDGASPPPEDDVRF